MKKAPFMDFEFETGSATLFPRPETEILVEKTVLFLRNAAKWVPRPYVLDIGTGCGNIAISLTKYVPSSRIVALDISATALRFAVENAVKHGVKEKIEFIESSLFEAIRGRREGLFDLIVSNPPYVSLDDFKSLEEAAKDDPFIALYGGRDGKDFYRKITREAPKFLKPGGFLFMEVGYDQARDIELMLEASGDFYDIEIYKDYNGINRIIKARKNG